mgnify:CR=1 FL=1
MHFRALRTPQRDDGLGADLTYIHSALDALTPILEARNGEPTLIEDYRDTMNLSQEEADYAIENLG